MIFLFPSIIRKYPIITCVSTLNPRLVSYALFALFEIWFYFNKLPLDTIPITWKEKKFPQNSLRRHVKMFFQSKSTDDIKLFKYVLVISIANRIQTFLPWS